MSIYRASLSRHLKATAGQRRQILAVDAVRHRSKRISSQLYNPPQESPPPWQCRWATASSSTLALRASLTGHSRPVRLVATGLFDETPFAVTIGDGPTAFVWDLYTGTLLWRMRGHRQSLTAVAVGRDPYSHIAVTADSGGTIRCWDVRNGRNLHELSEIKSSATSLATDIIDNTPIAVSGHSDGRVCVWSLRAGDLLYAIDAGAPVTGMALGGSDDSPVVAIGDSRGQLTIIDLMTGGSVTIDTGRTSPVKAIECASVGDRPVLITLHADGSGLIWELIGTAETSLMSVMHGNPTCMNTLTVIETGLETVALSGSEDGTIRLWDVASGELLSQMSGSHRGRITAITFYFDSSADEVGSDRSLDAEPDYWLDTLPSAWSRRAETLDNLMGYVIISASADETLRSWDVSSGQPREAFIAHAACVTDVKVNQVFGKPVALSTSEDGTAALWELSGRRQRTEGARHPRRLQAIAARRISGHITIATGCGDSNLRVFSAADGRPARQFRIGNGSVIAVGLGDTSEGAFAVTSATDGTITARHIETGRPVWKHHAYANNLTMGGTRRSPAVVFVQDEHVTLLELATGQARVGALSS